MNKTIIGITGASASGKTLFAQKLLKKLGKDECILISQDNFYKKPDEKIDIKDYNFDCPDAIDFEKFYNFVISLKRDGIASRPIYCFKTHNVIGYEEIEFNGKVILIEGIFSLNFNKLNKLMDMKIFIDTGLDLCLARRIERDVKERGRTLETILEQYKKFVRPGFYNYILNKKNICDIIIPNEAFEQYQNGLNIISNYLSSV